MKVIISDNAEELIVLSENVLAKHTADGPSSPLMGLNMAALQIQTTIARTQHDLSEQKSRDSETATQDRDLALGSEHRFVADTVIFYITAIRDFLFGQLRGREQHLGDWGYKVNMSSDIKVVIPTNVDEIIQLTKKVLAKHTADGATSILNSFNMADLQTKLSIADQQHALAQALKREAETATQDRNAALGRGKKQNTYSPGTVLFYVVSARDILLGLYRGREKKLGDWGYEVDESSGGGGTPPTPTPTGVFKFDIDETILQDIFPKMAGNASATGIEQLNFDHGNGYETVYTLQNGILTGYTISFNTAGVYHAAVTEITPEAFKRIAVIQFDNCKLSGTLTIPSTVQATNIEVPMNPLLTAVDMQQESYANLVSFVVFGCGLLSINENLIGLDNSGKTNGFANFSGGTNAAPSGLGIAAKNSLIAKGWTVITN